MGTFLVTGATGSLGASTARALVASGHDVVLTVRDGARGRHVATTLGPRAQVRVLDLASRADIQRFVAEWNAPLDGLVNIAGGQNVGPLRRTVDGVEETLAVNHLAPLELTLGLLPHLGGARVAFVGSGTHHPRHVTARMFGFRGARFSSIEALARAEERGSRRQLGADRYATSKLLCMWMAVALAEAAPEVSFFGFDPGLMPGTGLVRTAPGFVRLLWRTVLVWVAPMLPDTSTPGRSGAALARLLTDADVASGTIYGSDGLPSKRLWEPAFATPEGARRALHESVDFLGVQPPQRRTGSAARGARV